MENEIAPQLVEQSKIQLCKRNMEQKIKDLARVDQLFERISTLIEQARRHVRTTVNLTEVYTKFYIGQYIVEDEQQGQYRAQYGKQVLKNLSGRLTDRFGGGWSAETLKICRRFFLVYSNSVNSVYPIQDETPNTYLEKGKQWLPNSKSETVLRKSSESPSFTLSWSHYLILMRIDNPDERSFYEIECTQQQWSVRQLSRQVGSSLYERLALSRNKDEVMRLARENPTIGILLCKEKNDALVELTLPKDANIYAAEYSLYLPDKDLLQRKLKEWIDEYNELNPEEEQ